MQQVHITTKPAAAATTYVYRRIRSGNVTSLTIRDTLRKFLEWNMNCSIPDLVVITYSPKPTTAEIRCLITQHRVHFVTYKVGPQWPWFQQEHSVRTAGPPSTQDIWFPRTLEALALIIAPAIYVWTRHRRSQLAEHNKTIQWSTLFKSSVDHCRVQSIRTGENWPASFAQSDGLGKTKTKTYKTYS